MNLLNLDFLIHQLNLGNAWEKIFNNPYPTNKMKKITYTPHLKLRLKIRLFPEDYPQLIYNSPERRFFDNIEKTNISIKRLKYNKKTRNIMIAYTEENGEVNVITIHPISEEKIINRIVSKRWIKDE